MDGTESLINGRNRFTDVFGIMKSTVNAGEIGVSAP